MSEAYKMNNIDLGQKRDILFPFPLVRVGEVNTPERASYNIRDHGHLEFCLRLTSEEPEAVDELDGRIYRYGFPHLFIKKPGVFHRYTVNSSRYAVYLIYSSEMTSRFEACGMVLDPPGIEFKLTTELEKQLAGFLDLFPVSQEHGMAEKFDLCAFQLLESIYLQRSAPSGANSESDRRIREMASYLQLHFTAGINMDVLCQKFNVSRRSFFRHWARHYDISPLQYIMDLRIREAARLLSTQNLQVQEIADRLGFDNCAYFIQAFRRHHDGMTPGEFRRLGAVKVIS